MRTTTTTTPSVWIGCLACYNAGRLVGTWVPGAAADGFTPCQDPTHEEAWVMDHEGYAGLLTGECSPAEATRLAELLESVPEGNREAFAAWVANDPSAEHTLEAFEDAYAGEWESLADYAEELAHECDTIPDAWPFSCIDWQRAARELEYGGDVWTAPAKPYGVHVFRSY